MNRSPSSRAYHPGPNDDAAIIASHISGCAAVRTLPIGAGAKSGLATAATCTLRGHPVILDVWQAMGDSEISGQLTPRQKVLYAYGDYWTAFIGDQGVPASRTTLQLQLTDNAGALLRQAVNPPRPTPLGAQRELVTEIAKALSGRVASS